MKKMIFVVFYFMNMSIAQQSTDISSIKKEIQDQKESLLDILAAAERNDEIVKELQNIKADFALLSQRLGITRLFNRLRSILQKECDFVINNPSMQKLVQQLASLRQQLQDYKKTADFENIRQLEKTLAIITQVPSLNAQEKQEVQKLKSHIKILADKSLGPLIKQNKAVSMQISQKLQPYTSQINLLSRKVEDLIIKSEAVNALKRRMMNFKNDPHVRQVIEAAQDTLSTVFDKLTTLYDQKYALEQPCVMVAPGSFASRTDLFDVINQATVARLIED